MIYQTLESAEIPAMIAIFVVLNSTLITTRCRILKTNLQPVDIILGTLTDDLEKLLRRSMSANLKIVPATNRLPRRKNKPSHFQII